MDESFLTPIWKRTEFIIPNVLFKKPNQQKVIFAWGVVIFRCEERSVISQFLGRFRNAPEWPESKIASEQGQGFHAQTAENSVESVPRPPLSVRR
jgi:hypothetical protein